MSCSNSWSADGPAVVSSAHYPRCRCGGRPGSVSTVSVLKNQMKPPKLSTSYLNYLKKYASIRNGSSLNYGNKIAKLLSVWEGCIDVLNKDTHSGAQVFMHYATSETAFLILQPEWKVISTETKYKFTLVLNQVKDKLKMLRVHLESINNCDCLMSLIKNPWEDHNYLPKFIKENSSLQEVIHFMELEKISIYALRLKMHCEHNRKKLALKLSFLPLHVYTENTFEAKYYCDYQDLIFIREIYFDCLKMIDKKEFAYQSKKFNPQHGGKHLIEWCYHKISSLLRIPKESRPKICDDIIAICELVTSAVISSSLGSVTFLDDLPEQLLMWILMTKTMNYNNVKMKEAIRKFLKSAQTSSHCYLLADVFHAQLGSKLPLTMYIEMYMYALHSNISEKASFFFLNDKNGLFESLKMLVRGYLTLANILQTVTSVCRECVLTAYSLMPSKDLMVKVKKLAEKSGKLPPKILSSMTENYFNKDLEFPINHLHSVDLKHTKPKLTDLGHLNDYDLMQSELIALPDPLSEIMVNDFISVLKKPRYHEINWNLEWSEIEIECEKLLKNLDTIIKQNTTIASDLKYYNVIKSDNNCVKMENFDMVCTATEHVGDNVVKSIQSYVSSGEVLFYSEKYSKIVSRKRKFMSPKQLKSNPQKRSKIDSKLLKRLPTQRLKSQKYFDGTDDVTGSSSLREITSLIVNQNSNSEEKNSLNHIELKNKASINSIFEFKTTNKYHQKDSINCWCFNGVRASKRVGSKIEESLKNNSQHLKNVSSDKNVKHKYNEYYDTNVQCLNYSNANLSYLSARLPQLSSLEFLVPTNVNQIVNVVQIQATSNTLTNVSQTQTEHDSNHHSSNEIEKKNNDSQSNSNSLDNFTSVYQPNSLNNNINNIQNSENRQGECSFSGNNSVNKKIIDLTKNVQNTHQQETSKQIGTHDLSLNQNQANIDQQRWNDIKLKTSSEPIKSTVGNLVNVSSNVIVRTSDIINPSYGKTGHIVNSTKKLTYCVKSNDRFIDLTLPASISSTSTNSNRSSNLLAVMNSKMQQNSPVQTSVGLQVNFSNQQCENARTLSSSNQSSLTHTNTAENITSTNTPLLNDQIINPSSSSTSSNISMINSVLSTQTQTCIGLRSSKEVPNTNSSVVSLMVNSTQNQVVKTSVPNSLYTMPQNQLIQLSSLSHSAINRSDEQKKIDHLKLISQTFTATSEAIKFVTSNTESQRLIQSTEKGSASDVPVFHSRDGISVINQDNDLGLKLLNRGRGSMRTYESKTRALKQANMSDMFVFEKGTLYAVQDDVSQIDSTKLLTSSRNYVTNVKIQNSKIVEVTEKPISSPNLSPNITITGSMLPRFQQVFGKTKFQSSTVINDSSSLGSSSASSTPSNPGPVNRTNVLSRVYLSSKGVQTNHDVDQINSNNNCIIPKVVENKLQPTASVAKSGIVMTIGNNKNNVIMACKTVSSLKSTPQVTASSSHPLVTCSIDSSNGVEKNITGTPISKVTAFTTNCNNSSTTSSTNVIYSIPVQSDVKSTSTVERPLQGVSQIHKQLKMSPSIIHTVLRKYPNWQQNSFRQGKQSIEVQTSPSVERLVPVNVSNVVKTTTESLSNKVSVSTSKPNVTETNVSSSMMEQMREFESVLEEVRKTSLMNEMSTTSMLPQINHEIIQIHSPTENVDLLNSDSNQTLFSVNKKLSMNNERDRCSFSFLNQTLSNDLANEDKESSIISVRSVPSTPPITSPNNNVSVNLADGLTQCPKQVMNKTKPVIKTPVSSPSTSTVKVPVLQKPLPKLQEDEQTTQRIYAILDKYAEQLRNSPELKNKPAPRRRTNPPTNPSLNAKRKKSNQLNLKTCSQQTSCSSSGMEMSPTSDMQAIDSEDSSNAVSNFSHIINSPPSRNSDEQTSATLVASETPLIENTLINVNDVIKKINVDVDKKSKVSQSTQIVVSGTSGPFLSIPEGSAGNVRLLVAAGKNQRMYRVHCPVFHQITKKDSCSNDVKMSSNIIGQNIGESTILSTLTPDDLQVANSSLGNEILLNTSQSSSIFEHKINKSDIILESMEKAQVLDNNEKQHTYPVLKKSQASQSTFSVIHSIPCKSKQESNFNIQNLSEIKNNVSEGVQTNYCDDPKISSIKKELNNKLNTSQVFQQENVNKTLQENSSFIRSNALDNIEFQPFNSQNKVQEHNKNTSSTNEKNNQQNITYTKEQNIQIPINSENKILNDSKNLHQMNCDDSTILKQNKSSNCNSENATSNMNASNSKLKEEDRKPNIALSDVAAASAAEIISTANQTSNTYKQKENFKNVKTECESENENEKTLSNTVYNMLDNQASASMSPKIGPVILCLKNDLSVKNWNNCLSKILPPGTEKLLEGENLKQFQKSFQHTTIKTFKDLKMFVFEQCKRFDNNVETPKEYDLYDDIDGLGVDKPCTNELFPEVAILNDLDKSVSPTLGLLQASTSKSSDTIGLQAKRKSVLSHTTTSTVSENTTHSVSKKMKTKVSFLKHALYNEMNQEDSNDSESKPFINGSSKAVLEPVEQQIDLCPESPLNTTAVDSETCMSEDSTSTISSGTPHYNFRKSNKRKNIEEDGFIESQVIKRMYRGRASESEEKTEPPKLNTRVQTTEQKQTAEKKESNNRRISSRLKNNSVKSNQHTSVKSPSTDCQPYKITTTRTSLRRVSKKTI